MWYIRYTTGPNTNTPDKAAKVTAAAIVSHIKNIDTDGAYLRRTVEASIGYIGSFSAVAYSPVKVTNFDPVEEKPVAPNVCVWDKLSPAMQERVEELVGAPA